MVGIYYSITVIFCFDLASKLFRDLLDIGKGHNRHGSTQKLWLVFQDLCTVALCLLEFWEKIPVVSGLQLDVSDVPKQIPVLSE